MANKCEKLVYVRQGPEEEGYDWYSVVEAACQTDPDVYYDSGIWTSASNAKQFWEQFKKNGFVYNAPPEKKTGDEATDLLVEVGRNIMAKYLAYATKKSTDDPNGPFDYDDYIAWEDKYYENKSK